LFTILRVPWTCLLVKYFKTQFTLLLTSLILPFITRSIAAWILVSAAVTMPPMFFASKTTIPNLLIGALPVSDIRSPLWEGRAIRHRFLKTNALASPTLCVANNRAGCAKVERTVVVGSYGT